ncbi:MAG: CBS domain-containing protein [Gemmatimonadetes bacterium]|nr:CBS domain-containing protein [Gemmatimonadota bacterium]NIO32859.1 CBS domain-containing protein [Gemmatimonadota bacterium]
MTVEAMKRVKEIMIPVEQYPSVRDNATLREAIAKIEEAQLEVELRKSLPRVLLVFDEIDVLVGTVRRRDIMRGLEPKYLLNKPLEYKKKLFDIDVDPNLAELSYDRVVRGIREQSNRPVSDVMQPIPAILDADDHVMKAVQAMVALDVNLIPVLREGKLVGVVRSVDVFHDLAQLVR